ncbi:hypothetical protein KIN20_013025 [Parelaphostrongylus tenuis]|uniref:Uncharacterized protein n=1 Tax=Parelaphostrongylus tenuis TaxID=148309 RepID=A0AAD5QQS4_PARTN|nr:hypothetical protein KIN20_013025 [Parelaphostrongylus tenuis]
MIEIKNVRRIESLEGRGQDHVRDLLIRSDEEAKKTKRRVGRRKMAVHGKRN